jgi:glycosyltransferase involved in cell wall biosynthesis
VTDDRRTRVLVLVPTLGVGGAEMDLIRNLPRIDRGRFEIVVCAFLARGALTQPLMDAGIEVIGPISLTAWMSAAIVKYLPSRVCEFGRAVIASARRSLPAGLRSSIRNMLAIPLALLRPVASAQDYFRIGIVVAKFVRDRRIDLVHTILPNAYLVGSIAKLCAGRCGLVMSRVSLNWYQEQHRLLSLIERYVLHRWVDVVICNSAAIQQDLLDEGLSQRKIRLIPNGIDPQAFPNSDTNRKCVRDQFGIPQGALVFSVVASFYTYKGHADLLRALALVRDRLPHGWKLIAAGRDVDGNLHTMQCLSRELGLENHVCFLGERSDIAHILGAADIHISASHTEGFPNNILEAMCASLPVIATKVGGVPEMVVDGQTGLLTTARNSDEMARALLRLGHDPGLRASMGRAGRRLVASAFSLNRSVSRFEEVYAAVAMQRQPSLLLTQLAKA